MLPDEDGAGEDERIPRGPLAVALVLVLLVVPGIWMLLPDDRREPVPPPPSGVCTVESVDNANPYRYESARLPSTGRVTRAPDTVSLRHGLVHGYVIVLASTSARRLGDDAARRDSPLSPVVVAPLSNRAPFAISGSVAGSQIVCPTVSRAAAEEFGRWMSSVVRR